MSEGQFHITIDQRSGVPLYEQICEQFRQKIETRQLQPGVLLPTNHALRAQLQVNYKTAHQAMATLAKEGYVTRQARRGTIVKGIPHRGVVAVYSFPDHLSQDGKHEYYRLIMAHLSRQLETHARVHRQYLGSNSPSTPNMACDDLLRHLSGGSLCGVLLVKRPQHLDELMRHSRSLRIPVVALYGCGDADYDADYTVGTDLLGYVRAAAAYLQQQGRQRVGVIFNSSSVVVREVAMVAQILEECGFQPKASWIMGRPETDQGGYEAATQMPLAELDGLIVEDDVMAIGVDQRLSEVNANVPRDLMVTTFWNRGSRLRLTLPFERFELDVEKLACLSLQLMQDAVNGQRITERHLKIVPTHCAASQL